MYISAKVVKICNIYLIKKFISMIIEDAYSNRVTVMFDGKGSDHGHNFINIKAV